MKAPYSHYLLLAFISIAAMTTPVPDTYSSATGQPIMGGRFAVTQPLPTLTFTNATGQVPVMAGVVFAKGAMSGEAGTSAPGLYVTTKRTWNDGSIKHAIVSGVTAANVPVTFNSTPGSGVALTSADIQAAAPTAVVDLGIYGSVSLSDLIGSAPYRTWISNPGMVECHYRTDVPGTTLMVWFHVRLWSDGSLWVRSVIENPVMIQAGATGYTYDATVTVGATQVESLTQHAHVRDTAWKAEGWIGDTYDVVVLHDVARYSDAGMVPAYGMASAVSEGSLSSLPVQYVVGDNLLYTDSMGSGGYQQQIGLLPNWEAKYIASGGDARAWRSVAAHAGAILNYPIIWRNPQHEIVKPSDNPTGNYASTEASGGTDSFGPATARWEYAHHPSAGYLHYLISGDCLSLDVMLGQCAVSYQRTRTWYGDGTSRINREQPRGTAWFIRTLGQAAGIVPDSHPNKPDLQDWLKNNIQYARDLSVDDPAAVDSELGYPWTWGTYNESNPLTAPPWMHHFWIASMGHISDLEPLGDTDMASIIGLRDWMYRGAVGILGTVGGYCFTQGSAYTINASSEIVANFTQKRASQLYQTWAEVYAGTWGAPACENTLLGAAYNGGLPSQAATGYWGNLLPAISYAVKHNAPGAAEAWARVENATNYSDLANAGWESTPVWGVKF